MRRLLLAVVVLVMPACGSDDVADTPSPSAAQRDEQRYPDVVDVTVERTGETFSFDVTISSPYDSADRYADGWRVMGPDGTVFGEHTLGHDHANEQPFTRTQTEVDIPNSVDEVTVEGRDSEHGYGGATVTASLPTDGG